jgi:single-stranded-DNA-specific exonuclease
MKWETNKSLDEKISNISTLIDNNKLIARICYILGMNQKELLNNITEEELKKLICCILINRNVDTQSKINALFNNINVSITDPYQLVNAKDSADLITVYLRKEKAKIYIYADYDCDGACSGFILADVLRALTDNEVIVYFPERSEGYGININFCEAVISDTNINNEDKLVITVDNGITKKDEVKLLKDNNIEVIVTDHHPSKDGETPNCLIVNPHNSDIEQDDTFKHLCGAGVAFKVCQLVQENFNVYDMMNYTPYLALSTLSDVMPLTDENVALIQYGLEIMNGDNCPQGIKILKEQCKIDVMTSKDILWTVAPMINACGRMGNTALASKLFFNDDNIKQNVLDIIKTNEHRKTITKKAKANVAKMNFDNNQVCIIPTNEYPNGILGIVAGKATEMFGKPAIVAALTSDGHYHGSVRSCNGINMRDLLEDMKNRGIVIDFGGHAEACVCTFDINRLEDMNNYFNTVIVPADETTDWAEQDTEDILKVDEIITLDYLTKVIYAIVNLFPCDGKVFSNPTFALTDLKVIGYSLSKNNPENIKLTIKQGKQKQDIWAWGFGSKFIDELGCPSTIHIAGEITKSFMNGAYTLNVVDIMTA